MKWYKGLIICFILSILTAAMVYAEDNADNLTAENNPVEVVQANNSKINVEHTFYIPTGEVYSMDNNVVCLNFQSEDVNGTVAVQINNVEKINNSVQSGDNNFYFTDFIDELEYNTLNNISLLYSGNEKYLPLNYTSSFYMNYIKYDDFSNVNIDYCSWVTVDLPEDANGNVTLLIDNVEYDTVNLDEGTAYFWMDNLVYGTHTYEFRYSGDKKYPKTGKSGEFFADYVFDIYLDDDSTLYWSDPLEFEVGISRFSNIIVDLNGIKKEFEVEDRYTTIKLNEYRFGENTLNITYLGDEKRPQTSKIIHFNLVEKIVNPTIIRYNSEDGFDIKLPEDAKGNIFILENESIISTNSLDKGIVHIDLSKLEMGNHSLTVKYDGDDYEITNYNQFIQVLPYIKYNNSLNINEDNTISIELPQDADGNFAVEYNGKISGNNSLKNGIASISLNNLLVGENQEFRVYYNGNKYSDYSDNLEINVRNISRIPVINLNLNEKIVLDTYSFFYVDVGLNAKGYINITVGNKTVNEELKDGSANFYIPYLFEDFKMGKYLVEVNYSGDDYYAPAYNSTTVEITYISFNLPDTFYIGDRDSFYVPVSRDLTGKMNLYLNGKFYQTAERAYPEDEDYEDEDFRYSYLKFDLSELDYGEYKNAEIKFLGDNKYPKTSKKWSFNATYRTDVIAGDFIYGEPVEINVECLANINGNATISIEDKSYNIELVKGHGSLLINDLDIGDYNVTFNYKGDSMHPSSTYVTWLSVVGKITYSDVYYKSENNSIYLKLPENANGNLSVKIYSDNILIFNQTQKIANGIANISIDDLKLGFYDLIAVYDGNDYSVQYEDTSITVKPQMIISDLEIEKNNIIRFNMPEDAKGNFTFKILNDDYESIFYNSIQLKDGKAEISLNDYSSGIYYIEYNYTDEKYGNYSGEEDIYILKHNPKINVSIPNEIIAKDKTTITFTLPKDATGSVYVSFDEEYFEAKVKDGKASISIIIPKKGIKLLVYGYEGDDNYESFSDSQYVDVLKTPTIKAKDMKIYYNDGSYFKVTVYDSFSRLVVGKYVSFYIGSKKIKSVKTDKNGVAKLKITNVPKTYKITAKYRGASITKKVTVKQILTLKKVKVKKSVKKLVLKATLKKGKKALKYKKVTFKFNGKTYKAKTNKYGVAKVTIKKSVLKKLKTGKKVKYQVTYLKDTVKKTVKVKK